MTFFEAAVEILKTAQRPLDYKTITLYAINRRLLSHIGHTPEVVMATSLIRATQHEESSVIMRTSSGLFALRAWPEEMRSLPDVPQPESMPGVEFPNTHVGLLEASKAIPILEEDDIQFRKAVRVKFEADMDVSNVRLEDEWDAESREIKKYDGLRQELNARRNEHYNLCAAIVKILRSDPAPARSSAIAATLSKRFGAPIFEQAAVLAMRADNALRASRGKRAIFMHIPPDLWTLTENFLARHILKLESKLYALSRQLRLYSVHALSVKIRELAPYAWLQLSAIVLKHLNYTIISQCSKTDAEFIFRAEEARGLTYLPVLIKVIHSPLVGTEDIIQFREIIAELGYDHGLIMANGDISRDALNECTTKDLPIYAYSAKQIAPIMLDNRIGVIPNELPVVFIDNGFFHSLSAKDALLESEEDASPSQPEEPPLPHDLGVLFESDVMDEDFLFDDTMDALDNIGIDDLE
ncbi:MAG: winged helix-turn-helix domain-containing protein [Proteobacteria bacterium]|nr:winged helix-turn-helix domain-containing protein [Pseudomonadota bacterium]